jgi:S1-C subfamily serine protease
MTAPLQLRVRPRPGNEYPFESAAPAVRIGRAPGCDLALTGEEAVLVSWEHAQLDVGPDGVTVRDLGSCNGTYVNGRRIDGPRRVGVGDEIGLGQVGPRLVVAGVPPVCRTPTVPEGWNPAQPAGRMPQGKAWPSATRLLLLDFQKHQRKWWWGSAALAGLVTLTAGVLFGLGGKSLSGLGEQVGDLALRTTGVEARAGDLENRLQLSETAYRDLQERAKKHEWKMTAVERSAALLAEEARKRDQRVDQLAEEARKRELRLQQLVQDGQKRDQRLEQISQDGRKRDDRIAKVEDQARNIPARGEDIHRRLLSSVVWVQPLFKVKGGKYVLGLYTGTGSLVDRDRRLVMTACHVVEGSTGDGIVFFPQRDERGAVIREKHRYDQNYKVWGIQYRVVVSEPSQDLAVLELTSVPPYAQELPLAAESPPPGTRVHTTGNPGVSQGLWAYSQGAVKQVVRGRANLGGPIQIDCWLLETQNPINGGDSGGALVNDNCEQVGVCSFGRDRYPGGGSSTRITQVHTSFIDLFEIRSILTRVRRTP